MGITYQTLPFLPNLLHFYCAFCVFYEKCILRNFYLKQSEIALISWKLVSPRKNYETWVTTQIQKFLQKVLHFYCNFCISYKKCFLNSFYFKRSQFALSGHKLVNPRKKVTGLGVMFLILTFLTKVLHFDCTFCVSYEKLDRLIWS